MKLRRKPSVERQLLDQHTALVAAIKELKDTILMAIADVSAALAAYAAKVDAYVAAVHGHMQTVDAAVAAAMAADEAGDEAALDTLETAISESSAKVPDPPVAPG